MELPAGFEPATYALRNVSKPFYSLLFLAVTCYIFECEAPDISIVYATFALYVCCILL